MKKFSEIIIEGQKAGKTIEEINAELKTAGATFSLKDMDEATAKAKALKEQEEGFISGEEPLMASPLRWKAVRVLLLRPPLWLVTLAVLVRPLLLVSGS